MREGRKLSWRDPRNGKSRSRLTVERSQFMAITDACEDITDMCNKCGLTTK